MYKQYSNIYIKIKQKKIKKKKIKEKKFYKIKFLIL